MKVVAKVFSLEKRNLSCIPFNNFYRRCFRLADFKDTWNILQLGNNILLKVNMISVLIFLLELYWGYIIRVPKVRFTHQSASCSLAPLTMILVQCLWPGEYQEVHRKMAGKKSPMLISIELFEINFNRPTEKGNFICQPIRDRVWSILNPL